MGKKQMHHVADYDVFARLAAAQPSLTPKMARLATFVADNYVRVAFMNTRDLAAAAGVSPTTVVRFPALLGYRNFDDLRSNIQDRVNFDLTGVARLQQSALVNRSPAALLRRIIDADCDSLRALAQTFSEPQIERFTNAMLAAERVTIVGIRYVSPLTMFFEYSLAKIKENVQAYTHADSSLFDRVRLMDAGDVMIVIAFARYPAELVALARYAHRRGVRMLAITDSPLSPILPLAEVTLFAKTSMLDFVGSLAAPAALITCIVSDLAARLGDQAVDRLQALEDVASEAGIYVPAGGRAVRPGASLLAWGDGQRDEASPRQEARR
ncbi:MAG: MurR/RpiR family transcriptional regulator [Chloroflexota bacterium]|nr:MurR/RpiR family transcriptional regulator [Chloroflexota bacterium]